MRKNTIILIVLTICFLVALPAYGMNYEVQEDKMSSNELAIKDQPIKTDESLYERLRLIKEKHEKEMQLQEENIEPLGPAPALYYLEVYVAVSSKYPEGEFFEPEQLRSVEDHGGEEMYIATIELGYGHLRFARMNTSLLDPIGFEYIDLDNDSIVDGFLYWWDASGYEHGYFDYENTSSNYPFNNMTDSIYIR